MCMCMRPAMTRFCCSKSRDSRKASITSISPCPGTLRTKPMATTIRELLRKHFPPKFLPPRPDLPRPLFTGTVDFITY